MKSYIGVKVLSLAWKYHPSVTSGLGVACEGLNHALSKIVDITVIYPKVSTIQVEEEIILSSNDLSDDKKKLIVDEYLELSKGGSIEIAVKLDPYYVSRQRIYKDQYTTKTHVKEEFIKAEAKEIIVKNIKDIEIFDDVDVFGESVKDKIYVYNRLVEELIPNIQFDVIHAHDWMTFLAGVTLKHQFNKPLVLHVHSLEYDRVGHKDASWVYDIERYALSKADKVLTTSNYTKGIIESNYGLSQRHIETVPNAVTVPDGYESNRKNSNERFKVLFAGRIDGNKGIEYFLEIAKSVLKKSEDVEFIVVGRGQGKIKFEEIDGFDQIQSNFNYLGFVEREELFELYTSCDVLCMPSISEPFGLTAIEAAYVGLPVILSTKTGASEILKNTLKADFWDISKFSNHILSLKNNLKLRDRIISRNRKDIENLSWDTSAEKVREVYKELI